MTASHPFSARHLALLKNTDRWRFVASGLPEEVPPAHHCAHDDWARRHVDAHAHREILFVLSGAGYYGFRGRSYPLHPGTVFLFNTMEPHDQKYPSTHAPAEHLWFYFFEPERCCARIIRVDAGRPHITTVLQFSRPLTDYALSSAQALFPDAASSAPPGLVRQRCVSALALLVTRLAEQSYQPSQPPPVKNDPAGIIQAIVQHINKSHGRGCRLESLARIAGYNKHYFVRLFQRHAGMPLRQCIDRARVGAYRSMSAAGIPLKAITKELGFAYPTTLSRWRRRHRL